MIVKEMEGSFPQMCSGTVSACTTPPTDSLCSGGAGSTWRCALAQPCTRTQAPWTVPYAIQRGAVSTRSVADHARSVLMSSLFGFC